VEVRKPTPVNAESSAGANAVPGIVVAVGFAFMADMYLSAAGEQVEECRWVCLRTPKMFRQSFMAAHKRLPLSYTRNAIPNCGSTGTAIWDGHPA
jgi:hypothetical protein